MFLAAADPVTIAFACLGGGFGLYVGEKLRQLYPAESTAPAFFCFLGAVLAGAFAYVVLRALIIVAVLLGTTSALWHTREFWKALLEQLGLSLSALYTKHYAARTLRRKTAILDREHSNRVQLILDMDVDDGRQHDLLEAEDRRHQDAVEKLYPLNS